MKNFTFPGDFKRHVLKTFRAIIVFLVKFKNFLLKLLAKLHKFSNSLVGYWGDTPMLQDLVTWFIRYLLFITWGVLLLAKFGFSKEITLFLAVIIAWIASNILEIRDKLRDGKLQVIKESKYGTLSVVPPAEYVKDVLDISIELYKNSINRGYRLEQRDLELLANYVEVTKQHVEDGTARTSKISAEYNQVVQTIMDSGIIKK